MKVVDARGLSCPEPIMLTMAALKKGEDIKVLITEPHQKTNVEKYALSQKKLFKTIETEDGFEVEIKA